MKYLHYYNIYEKKASRLDIASLKKVIETECEICIDCKEYYLVNQKHLSEIINRIWW